MFILKKFISIAVLFCALNSHARDLTVEEKLSDFNQLLSTIQSGYGPLQYKVNTQGMNYSELNKSYAEKIRQSKSNGEFYYLLVQYVASYKDSHFSAMLPTTHVAYLPLITDLVEGKVVIDKVDRDQLSVAAFPYERGDEVLEINGEPVEQVLQKMKTYRGLGFDLTARRTAAYLTTFRPGKTIPVPEGETTLKIQKRGTTTATLVTLKWDHQGEPLDESITGRSLFTPKQANYDLLSLNDLWADLSHPKFEKGFRCSGTTRITIPKDATMIMQTPFVAYYHPTAKGNIGYLRIPEYYPQNERGEFEYELRFSQYEYAISVLEKNTAALIIDQDHNCGGSVEHLHKMVSLFMSEPFKPTDFQLLGNKKEYLSFKGWRDEMNPNTLGYQNMAKVLDLIKTAWDKGEFMTSKTSLEGVSKLPPGFVHYTKPIVMLIDEMSGSGGDAFPALMQGLDRAKLLGTRTMGAGGHVVEQPDLNYSQIKSRMTKSLFFRPDGTAIENNGATPDYPYAITLDDYVGGYLGYQAFYLSKVMEMIQE